jgi:hypothetical protein
MLDLLLGSEHLGHEEGKIRLATLQMVATPGQQATDIHRRLAAFVASHGPIALLDPPANSSLTTVVGTIHRTSLRLDETLLRSEVLSRPGLFGRYAIRAPRLHRGADRCLHRCPLSTT